MTTHWDAVVIGAGPAGSVAARQIALSGRRVLLLDKKRFPRRKVCGACLNQSAVTQLNELGLGHVLRTARAVELTRFDLRAGSRRLNLPLPSGRAISRATLDQLLVDEAVRAGVTFHDEVTATVGAIDGESRTVNCRRANEVDSRVERAKLVLAADGLGHPSLNGLAEITDAVAKDARVGAGFEVSDFPVDYVSGTIHMAVGRGGYVGLVRVETGALNIAAAFDPAFLREAGSPAEAASRILGQSGFAPIPALAAADCCGTPALTRVTNVVAVERLLVLGDAAGYVEPFTGEGIGWALSSASAIAPLAIAAIESWQPELAAVWTSELTRLVRRRQRTCRILAALLRRPICVRAAMTVLPLMPRLLRPIVNGVTRPAAKRFVPGRFV